ncbi:mannose-1-phosphate guanylyltransferase/mannose-6-phosphate isomerase [Orrella daihaiensis]|uniref:mannose-1-phosphate guanylyltransferase n=1 Tax=Orrella daihaiensis TaxID=2782176 RepID=A0ABY4AJG9_9BURK|nr:mannose-1-phosphate guanylyltransferase/mannose-6-phosphate isomerase [Orrella daihaiensis]UOD50432.1 mannose-1-phosphate guanylyltransferase/mannose-6-phosphate isomerase [Orrella daihaiensis]
MSTATDLSFVPVVLCGGSGTRLWPLSRNGFPKQFLVLHGNQSLFQMAVARLGGVAGDDLHASAPLIITNEAHRFLVADQLREIGAYDDARLLLEPEGRNTAPAITLAALAALANHQGGQDPVLVVSPADQVVTDIDAYTTALRAAITCASHGAVTILGVTPTRAETGFGYIECGAAGQSNQSYVVNAFKEKPDAQTAAQYLAAGNYHWNSGMFVVKASVWLAAIEAFAPSVFEKVNAAWTSARIDDHFVRPNPEQFVQAPSISADYAVLENCPGSQFPIEVVPLDAGWSDLGAWDAVWQIADKDDHGNATLGDTITVDTRDTLIHANYRLVGTVGVEDLVVVETADAVLIGKRSESQRVKDIVNTIASRDREEHLLHRKVHRPWGWYDSIDEGEHFKVKRIMVKPGASLSLQKHHHRAEHWIVVSGQGEVTCDDKVITLGPNQSTYIPQGSIHRLANRTNEPLELIEVQSGSYLGEDDIVRFEDHYGRVSS